jgi:phage tail sheath protein FI
MPTYLTPGVYVEEIERGPRPIEGVPTNIAAFIGETERGSLLPRRVTSYNEYIRWYGNVFASGKYMPYAAAGFFLNQGTDLYVSRVVGPAATPATKTFGDFTAQAIGPGGWGLRVWVKIQPSTTKDAKGVPVGFRLQVAYWTTLPASGAFDPFDNTNRLLTPRPQTVEDYDDLQVDPNSADYFDKRLRDTTTNESVSALISFTVPPGKTPGLPPSTPPAGVLLDQGGTEDTAGLGVADYDGTPSPQRPNPQGLYQLTLDRYRDVSLVYVPYPPANYVDIENRLIEHCEALRFRVAVIDCGREDDPGSLEPRGVFEATDGGYASFYAPWIVVNDPLTGVRTEVPPGGSVLGIYARSDDERGVFKAPANEVVEGALDVKFHINDATQAGMNPAGANAIRQFPDRGIRVWGARTLSSNTLWKYVSVRRLFVFLEHSIYDGTQWVVFEPNDPRLWARVKDTIRLFLRSQWRQGALFGQTEDQAFFITCDRTTMSQDDILNGRLICEIGIAPVRPAEFVIFRIFQNTADTQS